MGKLYIVTDQPADTAAVTVSTTTPWSSFAVNNKKRISYATMLLSAGLAKLDKFAAEKSNENSQLDSMKYLQEIQQTAKDNKLGIWSVEQPPELDDVIGEGDDVVDMNGEDQDNNHLDEQGKSSAVSKQSQKWVLGNLIEVQISDIVDGVTFYVHEVDKLGSLKSLTEELTAFCNEGTINSKYTHIRPLLY